MIEVDNWCLTNLVHFSTSRFRLLGDLEFLVSRKFSIFVLRYNRSRKFVFYRFGAFIDIGTWSFCDLGFGFDILGDFRYVPWSKSTIGVLPIWCFFRHRNFVFLSISIFCFTTFFECCCVLFNIRFLAETNAYLVEHIYDHTLQWWWIWSVLHIGLWFPVGYSVSLVLNVKIIQWLRVLKIFQIFFK